MTSALAGMRREVVASGRLWLCLVAAFFVGFHAFQLALLIVRFEGLPNYLVVHDWPGNIAGVARSTPAVSDMIGIMLDEWLIEVGSMNYAFGRGIAEWSFVFMPAKAVVVLAIAALLATNLVLLRAWRACTWSGTLGTAAVVATGAMSAGAAATTITWVVCCAAPSWVVGLAVMGMSVTTALALQPIGGLLSWLGLALLAGMAFWLARQVSGRRVGAVATPPVLTTRNVARVPS